MRTVSLSVLQGGINRLRVKGGASPSQLYDLLNGYVNQAGAVQPREGTIRAAQLNSSTAGCCAVDGIFYVFSNTEQSVPAGYQCVILINPVNAALTVSTIWFAKPFMGFLYVTAQFSDGSIYDYWLQNAGSWAADTVYMTGNIVLPTSPNGLGYLAVRDYPVQPTWAPETITAVNSVVEPTDYTGYAYKAIAVAGAAPHTGSVEPAWPAVNAATIQEFGDFSATSTAATSTTTTSEPLPSTITDRYGDSNDIAGNDSTPSTLSTLPTASTAVTTWAAGTLYAPGAVVQPSTNQGAYINAIPNGDFENGNDGNWVGTGSSYSPQITYTTTNPYQGTYCLEVSARNGIAYATMLDFATVAPGQSVTATAYLNPYPAGVGTPSGTMAVVLNWYNSSDTLISSTQGGYYTGAGYRKGTVTGIAPATAAFVKVSIEYGNTSGSAGSGLVDLVTWSLAQPSTVSQFLYEAVQAASASSGSVEPTWPLISGDTVIDGGVTWQAVGTSIITWEAIPIMESGATQPTWPTTIGNTVSDGNMSWEATTRQITDTNDPNTIPTCIGASHVFKGDVDITAYSAAVNPTDYTSANNAGYLPTGLNNYGDNPVMVLALYRSNLMVFNAGGYQMWQIDPDPANMALLDAQPVGSIYPRAAQSVANDLLFLTEVGVRNIGTVGATANMQLGSTGQPVDPLVKAQLQAATYTPISLYYPGRGQYWLFFGPQAFVLTQNGQGMKSWSRYVFPDTVTDWTFSEGVLYLRTAGNLVWQLDANTMVDDFNSGGGAGGNNVAFTGVIQWPYIDMGNIGRNKMVVGFDMVGAGSVTVQMGFNENDATTFSDNAGFATSQNVTAPLALAIADTVPGNPVPFPLNIPTISVILTFAGNQAWGWQAMNLYVTDQTGGGGFG